MRVEKLTIVEFDRKDIHKMLVEKVEEMGYEMNGTITDIVKVSGDISREGAVEKIIIEVEE